MTWADKILSYQFSLTPAFNLPNQVEWLLPYEDPETRRVMTLFYHQYYDDTQNRIFILGINPGRFGAGMTGIPFTDPIRLEETGITNAFKKRQELSSVFIYRMIEAFGGPQTFYAKYHITSLSPLGFIRHGKNYNYYDDRELSTLLTPYIEENIGRQMEFGADRSVAYCLGQGKNYSFLKHLNEKNKWWDNIIPLPHPRWIMQYRLKQMDSFVEMYLQALH